MNNIKLTKASIALTVLFVISIVMLPIDYFWGTTGMEYLSLEKEYHMMPGLLLWVFVIAQVIAAVLAVLNRYDLAVFANVIGACGAVLALLLEVIDYGEGFLDQMGTGIIYCVIAIAAMVICVKKKKTAE